MAYLSYPRSNCIHYGDGHLFFHVFFYSKFFPGKQVTETQELIEEYEEHTLLLQEKLKELNKDLEEIKAKELEIQQTLLKKEEKHREQNKVNQEVKANIDELLQKVSERKKQLNELIGGILSDKEKYRYTPLGLPVQGNPICGFGKKIKPLTKREKLHTGLDIAARLNTPVYATAEGRVKFTGTKKMADGLTVEIKHGKYYYTRYKHLSRIVVRRGQKIKRGDLIGYVGETGIIKAVHLHYEILKNDGTPLDPLAFVYLGSKQTERFKKLLETTQSCKESLD